MGGNGISASKAIEAAKGSRGFVTAIAKTLGCSRTHIYNLMEKYPTFKQAIIDEREEIKDFAESKLFSLIDDANPTAIIFYLKTQARDRGYVERQEVRSYNVDVSQLSDDELERLARGEEPFSSES